ncbi:MAG: hypothetical protein IKY79_01015 [Bacteroidales bacterium]|nr:hypothetical protein [Bacteroidales bacterium]
MKCIAKIQLFYGIRKQKLINIKRFFRSCLYSKEVSYTNAAGWGTIIINPWPDTIVEGYFDLTIPTITGDSTGSEFEG